MIKKILKKFYQGRAERQEVREIVDWYYSKAAENELDSLLEREFPEQKQDEIWNQSENFERIKEKLQLSEKSKPKIRKVNWNFWTRVAASFLFIAGMVYLAANYLNYVEPESAVLVVSQITKNTDKGQKLTVFLPDGSEAILNAASSISYHDSFENDSTRIVYLSGEVFFQVKPDANKPFIVTTKNLKVTALGTSFNVNEREGKKVKISLVSGKVSVENETENHLVLLPGEQAIAGTGEWVKQNFNYQDAIAWKDGELVFKQTTFEETLEKLELWYGADIIVKNHPSYTSHYTGNFKNKSLEQVLEGIAFVYGFSFEIKGKHIEIKFNL